MVVGKPESLYELGYILLGRKSIFLISTCLAFLSFGLVIIYFKVFSAICASLMIDLFLVDHYEGFLFYLSTDIFWIIILGIFILPICLMKRLEEL
jgi:amino acid permease